MLSHIIKGNIIMASQKISKVLWLLNPFEENAGIHQRATEWIEGAAKLSNDKVSFEIQPAYLLIPDEVNRLASSLGLIWTKEHADGAREAMKSSLKNLNLPGLKEALVIGNEEGSRVKAIKNLATYVKTNGYHYVLASTHARKGAARFFLGSFTETLLLHANVPTIVINPTTTPIHDFNRLFFPSAFSEREFEAFQQTVLFAKDFGSEIDLFHQIIAPIAPLTHAAGTIFGAVQTPVQGYFDEELQKKSEKGEEWAKWATEEHGVKVNCLVQNQGAYLSDEILKEAEETKASMIVMTSHKKAATAVMIGSVARQVVRGATRPVWVIHQS
jgi:nucleotide-binding universal stress UspA family protein